MILTRPARIVNGQVAGHSQPVSNGSVLTGPTILRHRLGIELRKLRDARDLRLEDVAAQLDVAPSTLSRIETGKAPARTSYVYAMLDFYGIEDPDQRRHLGDLAREGQRKGWWAEYDDLLPRGTGEYLGLEAAASHIGIFAVQAIPSLLQTAEYAEAAIKAARPGLAHDQIKSLVTITMRRQEVAYGKRELHVIVDESALLRSICSPEVMAAQLDHLSSASASPLVTVQVVRLAAPVAVLSPGFTILAFEDLADMDVGCRDSADDHMTITSDVQSVRRLRNTFARLRSNATSAENTARLIEDLRKRTR